MKRSDLLRHLRNHGCELIREGGRHSWWGNRAKIVVHRYPVIQKSMKT